MKLTYGYTVKDKSDEYIKVAERAVNTFSAATAPGAFLVDIFPSRESERVCLFRRISIDSIFCVVKYVPWTPFKRTAVKWRAYLTELIEMPMGFVYEQMVRSSPRSYLKDSLIPAL